MRYRLRHGMLRTAVFMHFLLLFSAMSAITAAALPAEPGNGLDQHREFAEGQPFHENEGFLELGYRWFSLHDSANGSEFQDPHSSLSANLDIASYPLPHRFHLTTEYLSADNYYGDAGYALSDLLLMRDIFTGIYHKLDSYNYQHAGQPPFLTYNNRNAGDEYHVNVFDNFFSLRFKAPDFPFHTFLKHRYVAKEGIFQQRFVINSLTSFKKVSQTRMVDWQSNALTLGTNSHLGPIEIEYSYEATKFDPGNNNILYDAYPAVPTRPADTYPHDVIPETESSANSLKAHSSYTGGLVAAATLSTISQKNNYSGTRSDTWQGATDLSYLPFPELNFFFKYRHHDLEINNPDSVTLRGLANATSYSVRQAISSQNDVFTLSARYRPVPKITILSNYEFSHKERTDTDQWPILSSDHTESNSIKLAGQVSPLKNLKFKLSTDYRFVNNAMLNIEPDYANHVQFSSTYLPAAWITAFLSYNRSVTARDNVRYLNSDTNIVADGGRRETKNDRLMASLSCIFSPKTILTTSYAYYSGKIEQNLAYKGVDAGTGSALLFLDRYTPYLDRADFYSVSLFYVPLDGLTIMTNVSHTVSEGKFTTGLAESQNPVSLAAFSEVKVAETNLALELTKALQNKWEVGLKFHTNLYNDRHEDSQDGRFDSLICSLTRHF